MRRADGKGGRRTGASGPDGPRRRETPRRKSHLTAEDEALWRYVSGDLTPMPRAKPRVPHVAGSGPDAAGAAPVSRGGGSAPHRSAPHPTPAGPQRPRSEPPPAKRADPPPINAFDRRRERAIVAGRLEIEARLDLHGLRQSEAHHRLRTFLLVCASKGYSTVLVVTGKGGSAPQAHDELAGYGAPERGVLRRNVPRWLEEPDMRALVASYTSAGIKHGGEGALYIHLRRRRA